MTRKRYRLWQPGLSYPVGCNKRVRFIVLMILTSLTLFSAGRAVAGQKLELNYGNASPYIAPEGKGFYADIAAEAFRRIDIEAEVIYIVSARSLINANQGIEDGNMARIAGMEKKFPNLIPVPEKIVDFEFTAFTREVDFKVDGWGSLKPYEVGIVTGWKIYGKNITEVKLITKVKRSEQLFRILDKGRIEVAMYERWDGAWLIKELGLDLRPLDPPITVKPLYLYLHKKPTALVPKVAQALIDMKKDGSYQAIYDRNFSALINY
jgi:polar amino acid transport system substrate-binding protein